MSAPPRPGVRGTCPGAYDPMESGDGWLVRVRPPASGLTARQASGLCEIARACGNGTIEITSRGNLQLRGLSRASHERFVRTSVALGLVDPDPARERRRRIVAAPNPIASPLLAALEASLREAPVLDRLAPKFAIGVGIDPETADTADLVLEASGRWVAAGGWAAATTPQDAIASALGLAGALASLGGACGADRIRALDDARLARLFASAGLVPRARPERGAPRPWIGRVRFGDDGIGAIGVAPAYGALEPGQLGRIASVADRHADGRLHVTPARGVLIPGATTSAHAALADLDLVLDPGDLRLRVRACPGAPSCRAAEAPARAVADRFLELVPARGILHISGCAKGCAHPHPAALVLTGAGGSYVRAHAARADGTHAAAPA